MTDTGYMAPESRRNYGDTDVEGRMPEETMADNGKQPQSSDRGMAKQQSGTPDIPDAGNSYDRMKRLSADEEFSALLYAVQQYLGKTFSAIECEKFAYFYDVLHMSCELLEYLAEYCAEGGHTSIRYIEKVALNWYQAGIHTRDEAREHSTRYSKDTSAVMKPSASWAGTPEPRSRSLCAAGSRSSASTLRSSRRHATGRSQPRERRASHMPTRSSQAGRKTACGPYRT